MALKIVNQDVAAALAVLTDQTAQVTEILSAFGGGNVTIISYDAGGTPVHTSTHGPMVADALTPRGWAPGIAPIATTVNMAGVTITRQVFRNSSGVDIYSLDGADITPVPLITRAGKRHRYGGRSTANSGLPVTASPTLLWAAPSPASGSVDAASGNFTATLVNGTGSVLVTPGVTPSGTWTPTSRTLTVGAPTGTFTLTPVSAAVHSATLANNAGLAAPAALSYTATAVAPTTATLSGATSATKDVAQAYTVTLNQPADQTYTITWSRSNSGTGSDTSTIAPGASTATATSTWAAAGPARSVDFTISPTLTRAGNPITVTVTDAAAPGAVTTIGTQSLADYLGVVRAALPEGLTAADARMMQRNLALAYCGASTIWRDKLAFPILGGHGDSFDDGGYAQDLTTGAWETLIGPSTDGSSGATVNSFGEWTVGTVGRPASQHTIQHLVTVGDDLIQGLGSYIGVLSWGSRQAHRWNFATGLWQRYGTDTGGVSPSGNGYCHYDAVRNRIVRINLTGVYGKVDTIPANDPNADWTPLTIATLGRVDAADIGCSIGYYEALDCYVLISPDVFAPRNKVYVMDAGNIVAGWTEVSVSGDIPPAKGNGGLEYCPPMRAMVTVDATVNNRFFYIKPTGSRTAPWVWSSETFTGSAIEAWEGNGGGNYNGVYRRIVWSELKRGFVVLKKATAKTELYVPVEVAAYYDWQDRAAAALAAGVTYNRGAVAYDFSDEPANGGVWQWGSLSAAPNKVTCEARNRTYDTPQANLPDHARDLAIYPPGSHGSLRLSVPQGVANAGDEWRFGIDDFDKQFREGDEFWVCWRTRLNATAATHRFKRTSNDTNPDGSLNTSSTWDGAYTDSKHSFWGYGMQTPRGPGQEATTGTYYGYSPGASQSDNVMASCRTDVRGEIVMILEPALATPGPGTVFKYPLMYVGKPGVYPLQTRGQNINYFTERNEGDETTGNNTGVAKACERFDPGGGAGWQYTDYSTCFIYPTDEWFSLMEHVTLGQPGTATQAGTSESITGYINSVIEYYGAYAGQPWSLLHRRTLHISYDGGYPGGQGVARFGMFGWTSFMTAKWRYESHPTSIYWVSQIILQPGPTMPAAPI